VVGDGGSEKEDDPAEACSGEGGEEEDDPTEWVVGQTKWQAVEGDEMFFVT
jgi:hypothetical protein